ncbi:hypothetical protein CCP4SC76_7640016 [Gammaproteobacteria bacterium]
MARANDSLISIGLSSIPMKDIHSRVRTIQVILPSVIITTGIPTVVRILFAGFTYSAGQ